jgi:hypothetical protein
MTFRDVLFRSVLNSDFPERNLAESFRLLVPFLRTIETRLHTALELCHRLVVFVAIAFEEFFVLRIP